jgi:hypothetical protein
LRPPSGNPDFLEGDPFGLSPEGHIDMQDHWEIIMGKGDNKRGNKEVKKPKQEKTKVLATANFGAAKPMSLGEKKKGK